MTEETPKKIDWKEIIATSKISILWYIVISFIWWIMGIYPHILFSLGGSVTVLSDTAVRGTDLDEAKANQAKKQAEDALSNQNNLKKIIKIVHPEVRKKMKLFLQKNKNKKVVIMDIPLLLENKLHEPEDVIICIDANQKLLDAKLKQRPSYNKKMISILRKIQLPIEEKKLLADFVLVNNYNKKTMQLRVKELKKMHPVNT